MTKQELQKEVAKCNAKQWQLAKIIGIHECTFCKWLHDDEIPEYRAVRIKRALEELKESR